MASLTGSSVASSYKSLLKLNGNTDTLVAGNGSNAIQIVHSDDSTGVTSPLFLNTDRLGIGGQPTSQLSVIGIKNTTTLSVTNNWSTTNDFIQIALNDATIRSTVLDSGARNLIFAPLGNDALTLHSTSGGAVSAGIGTTTPTLSYGTGLNLQDTNIGIRFSVAGAGGWGFIEYVDEAGTVQFIQGYRDTDETFRINASNSLSNTDGIAISNSGLVGIGTEIPGDYDAGADNLVVYDSANAGITIAGGTSGQSSIHFGDGTGASSYRGVIQYRHSSDEMRFWSNGAHKLTLNSSGDLDFNGNYVVDEQGRQNHVANTMSSPYYRLNGSSQFIDFSNHVASLRGIGEGVISLWFRASSQSSGNLQSIFHMTDASTSVSESTVMYMGGNIDNAYADESFYVQIRSSSTARLTMVVRNGQGFYNDDKWHHIAIVVDGVANSIYVDGVSQTITFKDGSATTSGYFLPSSTDVDTVVLGKTVISGASNYFFNGEIQNFQIHNHGLDASEVKELYSGMSVPYKYKGANQTDLVTSNFVNNGSFPFDTFTGASANGFTAVRSTSGTKVAGTADEIVLVKGKSYRVSFDVTLTSGTFPLARVRESQTSGTLIEIVSTGGASDGDKINFEFTATASGTYVVSFESSNSVSFAIANFNFVQIGAVAEYDGSSAGEKVWGDKSGNSLDGTVSGATLENAPYDAGTEYEEGTFDPVWVAGTGSFSGTISYQNRVGKYVKIGNAVHITISFYNNEFASTGGSGAIKLGGLPYTASAKCALALGDTRLFADDNPSEAEVGNGTTNVILYIRDGNADVANSQLQVADLLTGSGIVGNLVTLSGTYFT